MSNARGNRSLGVFVFLLCIAMSCLTAKAQSQSQPPPAPPASPQKEDSAAEAARKAKADKAKSKTKKVYTEDDLANLQGAAVSVVGKEATEEEKNSESEANQTSTTGKNEAYWRGRARKLRDQMAAVDQAIVKLKDEIAKGGGSGFDVSTGLKQDIIYINDRNARLQKLEKQKEKLEKDLDQLQDEGRRAGASPEWFR